MKSRDVGGEYELEGLVESYQVEKTSSQDIDHEVKTAAPKEANEEEKAQIMNEEIKVFPLEQL